MCGCECGRVCEHVCRPHRECWEVWIHRCGGLLLRPMLSASASQTRLCPHVLGRRLLTCRFALGGYVWGGVSQTFAFHHLLDATAPCIMLRCHQAAGTQMGRGPAIAHPDSQPALGREPRPLPPALEAVAVLGAPWLPRGPYSFPPMFYRLCEGSSGIEGRQQVGLMCLGNSCSSGASSHNSFAKLWP